MFTKQNRNMNTRYDFNPETFPSLRKFLEQCKDRKPIVDQETQKVWKLVLPTNEHLLNQLQTASEEEVITIQSSESPTPDDDVEISSIHSCTDRENEKKHIEDIATVVIQQLKSDGQVTEAVLNLIDSELEELFSYFVQHELFDSETTCLFGQYFVVNKKSEKDKVLKYYCRHLLINELKEKEKEDVRKTFLSILSSNPTIVCTELAKCCVTIGNDECPRALPEYLKHLQGEHKEHLLREFVLNCTKVEKGHFSIIESLVVGRVDFSVLKKLIDLFSASSNEYGANRSFGKLLLHVLQKIGNQIYRFEADVQNIITHHKSPWRNKILKTYESNAGNTSQSTMSQII